MMLAMAISPHHPFPLLLAINDNPSEQISYSDSTPVYEPNSPNNPHLLVYGQD